MRCLTRHAPARALSARQQPLHAPLQVLHADARAQLRRTATHAAVLAALHADMATHRRTTSMARLCVTYRLWRGTRVTCSGRPLRSATRWSVSARSWTRSRWSWRPKRMRGGRRRGAFASWRRRRMSARRAAARWKPSSPRCAASTVPWWTRRPRRVCRRALRPLARVCAAST